MVEAMERSVDPRPAGTGPRAGLVADWRTVRNYLPPYYAVDVTNITVEVIEYHLAKIPGQWDKFTRHPPQSTMQATGTFTVKMVPLESYANTQPPATLGRMALDKSFSGPLEATSQGEMLTGMTAVKGSAGYVALEKVTGTLEGKSGSFLL